MDGWDQLRELLPLSLAERIVQRLGSARGGGETARLKVELVLSRGHIVDIRWDPNEQIPVKNGCGRA